MLDMEEFYENLDFWGQDLGLPEVTWTDGLFSSSQEHVKHESGLEGDSFWKDAHFPLKEANKNKLNDPPIDEAFDLNQDFMNDNGWLDQRIDLGEALENFIYSPEFEEVLNDLNESEDYMKSMSAAEESSTVIKEEENLSANLSIESESSGADQVEIETNEVSIDGNTVYYLNPCEMSSPSTSDSDEIHYVVSPSISKSNDEIIYVVSPSITKSSKEILVLENVDTHHINRMLISENEDAHHTKKKLKITEIAESSSSNAISVPSSSYKSKKGRRNMRLEPYKYNSDDSSSCSSGNSSSNFSSAPGSPQLSDSEEPGRVPTIKKKERKKYQNRNAATKYRQKKRKQTEAISMEEQELENKNKELKGKCEQLSNEVGYLKNLMRDILIAKGLLKK